MKKFILLIMGFKENLKEQLIYSGMYVKELATQSGIKKQTIDSYLNVNASVPSAEAAVAIARALGVSVEYLVTGHEPKGNNNPHYPMEARLAAEIIAKMNEKDRKLALAVIKAMRKQEEQEDEKKNI